MATTTKRNSRASIRKKMNQKVQAVLKMKVDLFTEIAAQEEAIDAATVESAKAIRTLQENDVTMDEVSSATGISTSRLRAIVKHAEELSSEEEVAVDEESSEALGSDSSESSGDGKSR